MYSNVREKACAYSITSSAIGSMPSGTETQCSGGLKIVGPDISDQFKN
jgi:hypothetical protein